MTAAIAAHQRGESEALGVGGTVGVGAGAGVVGRGTGEPLSWPGSGEGGSAFTAKAGDRTSRVHRLYAGHHRGQCGPAFAHGAEAHAARPVGDARVITFKQLHEEVCRFANALADLGVGKGDRVALYLGMVPELPVAMLACARLGAVHSVVFGGFSADSLSQRIQDAECKVLVTGDGSYRRGTVFPLKAIRII